MKKISKCLFIVIIFVIFDLIFNCKISYGAVSVDFDEYNSNQTSMLADTTDTKTVEPIVSMKSKIIWFIFILSITGLIYFIPTIVSLVRNNTYKIYIIGINILLGWTLLGWIVCLIWSFVDKKNVKE